MAAYRTAECLLEQWEKQSGLTGLCQNFLPIIERAITGLELPKYEIPPEVRAITSTAAERAGGGADAAATAGETPALLPAVRRSISR